MTPLRASPFVPGLVSGILRHHPDYTEADILLLSFHELEQLSVLPAGLIMVGGAPLAHPMIRLYGYGIPTVVVSPAQAAQLLEGTMLRLDGYRGWLSDHDEEGVSPYARYVPPTAGAPVLTADGVSIELRASVASAEGVAKAVAKGACTIGMVRSEFLVPQGGKVPDEAFYYQALQQLCAQAGELPVTIRLLDIAPDKHPAWLGAIPGMSGPLGLRGARLYQHEPVKSVFLAELQALARLAGSFDIRLLLPYMTRPEELAPLRVEIQRIIKHPIPLGVMIETPAAALALPEWLELVDFVVIGCNDMMQCLFAADRDIPAVAQLLDPYAPVLYRLLRQMAQSVPAQLARVQLGGLLPQVPGVLPLLIGLGYRNFSAEPLLTPCLAAIAAATNTRAAQQLASQACSAKTAAEVRELLELPAEFFWGIGQ